MIMVRPKWPSQFAWAFWHRKGGTPPTPPTPEGIVLANTETKAKTYSPATMEWEVFNNTKYPLFRGKKPLGNGILLALRNGLKF